MKKTIIPFLALLLLVCSCTQRNNYVSDTYFAMNTVVTVVSEDKTNHSEINAAIVDIENKMSRTLPDSEIYKLNKDAECELSDETLYVLEKSLQIAKDTDFAFNPCMGTLSDLWDITSGKNTVPSKEQIDAALKSSNPDNLNIHGNKVYASGGLCVDLGGIAKGYALEKALEKGGDNTCINLGGNVGVCGSSYKNLKDGKGWDVGITNPFDKNTIMGTLNISHGFVSISGAYERYFEKDGKVYHHIFDSKTGYPSDSTIASSVVVSDDGLLADALSTALFVMGRNKAIEFYNSGKYNFSMMLVTYDKEIVMTGVFKESFSQNKDLINEFTITKI